MFHSCTHQSVSQNTMLPSLDHNPLMQLTGSEISSLVWPLRNPVLLFASPNYLIHHGGFSLVPLVLLPAPAFSLPSSWSLPVTYTCESGDQGQSSWQIKHHYIGTAALSWQTLSKETEGWFTETLQCGWDAPYHVPRIRECDGEVWLSCLLLCVAAK